VRQVTATAGDVLRTDLDLPPAPGADRHVALDLVNSAVALPGGHVLDLLGTPDSANAWLTSRGLAPAGFGMREQCAAQLRALREQLRALVAAHLDGLPPPGSALAAVNDAMTRVPTAEVLRWDAELGLRREASHPVTQALDHALAVLAVDAAELLAGADAHLLAACGAPSCRRYLLRTHGRRQWCSVRCGDRVRAARAYARRTAGSRPADDRTPRRASA
jgi:predicted RNA-binding Zn ribbon-like protein